MNAPVEAARIATDRVPNGASISVRNLSVTYSNGFTAVRDASFELDPGTICALVGVNGSGKSTIFKAIMGFVRPVGRRRAALRHAGRRGVEEKHRRLCAAERGRRLELSRCWSRPW